MRVTVLKTAFGPELALNAGDVVELPDALAQAMIDAGAATPAVLTPDALANLADH